MEIVIGNERLLKATEVAQILNVSKAFVYQLMRKGVIPTVRILGARRVRLEDLHRFIKENVFEIRAGWVYNESRPSAP